MLLLYALLKCGAAEECRSAEPILWEMKKCYKESMRQGVTYIPFKHFHRGFETPYGVWIYAFVGKFTKLRDANINFDMPGLPVRMEQFGSHYTDLNESLYFSIFRKHVNKTQVTLKPDKNNGYFTWRPTYLYDNISLISSWNEKCFRQKLYRKSKHILCSIFFLKIVPFIG
jgi:hypothetical protein